VKDDNERQETVAILSVKSGLRVSKHKTIFRIGAIAIFFLLLSRMSAQDQRIVGPGGGGAMFHVTISPHDPNEVLLSCDMTGAYISHDGGHNWRMFSLRGTVHFFAFDPVQPHTIYAATDALFRSNDDGGTWQLLWPQPSTVRGILMDSDHADETLIASPNPVGTIITLAIDPADPRILYAAAANGPKTSLVVSRDSGLTWQQLRPLPEAPLRICMSLTSMPSMPAPMAHGRAGPRRQESPLPTCQ
jgi:hypothetical protein